MSSGRFSVCIGTLLLAFTVQAQEPGVYLGDLSWPEAERRYLDTPIVVIPFGAGAKEHGPHLPMNADRVVMDHLVVAAVESRNVIVTPPILHEIYQQDIEQFTMLQMNMGREISRRLRRVDELLFAVLMGESLPETTFEVLPA